MNPSLLQYQMAVQNPHIAFAHDPELVCGETQLDRRGMPRVASGGFAATFRIHNGERHWAVRCFHRNDGGDRDLLERYRQIGKFIAAHPTLAFLVPVEYVRDGIVVEGGAYPTVRMRWVEGKSLGVWLARWANCSVPDPRSLETVRTAIRAAVEALRRAGVAHGDLQHGNILVRPDLNIWLIDYDGMYLPGLADYGAIEEGHRNYQHPDRGAQYDDTLDRFAAESIDLSLSALVRDPRLWEEFGGTGENLLFKATDFADPERSALFGELESISDLTDRVHRFRDACRSGYRDIEGALRGRPTATLYGPRSAVSGLVVAGDQTAELRSLAGQVVTVFGRVVSTKMVNDAVALINLGEWTDGDFTIVGFDEVADALYERYGRDGKYGKWLPSLKGQRVAVTGLITLYQSKHAGQETPQVILDDAQFLQILEDTHFDEYARDAQRRFEPRPSPGRPLKIENSHAETKVHPDDQGTPPFARSAVGHRQPASKTPLEVEREATRNALLDKRYRNKTSGPHQLSRDPTPPAQNRPPPVPPRYRTEWVGSRSTPSSSPPVPPSPPKPPAFQSAYAYQPPCSSVSPRRNQVRCLFVLIVLVAQVVWLILMILL